MKAVCLLSNKNDVPWITEYLRTKSDIEDISVVAYSFEGRVIAESMGISYKTYEKEAWEIDRAYLFDSARIKANQWHKLQTVCNHSAMQSFYKYKKYPLLTMHQSRLMLIFYSIFQTLDFVEKIICLEQPDKVVSGNQGNSLNKGLMAIMSLDNGLESLAAKVITKHLNIEYVEFSVSSESPATFLSKVLVGLKNPGFLFTKAYSLLSFLKPGKLKSLSKEPGYYSRIEWSSELDGSTVLIFAWADYYFKQILPVLDLLLEKKTRIGLVITGGRLTEAEVIKLREKGIYLFYKADWETDGEKIILAEWKDKGNDVLKSILKNKELKEYFSNPIYSYFNYLVDEAIGNELENKVPETVIELMRSESIIDAFKPDVVFAHFAMHPLESCNVLPARVKGIPTLISNHGVTDYRNTERYTNASEYYAVEGEVAKEALMSSLQWPEDKIFLIGDSSLENLSCKSSIYEAKKKFGFNTNHPLCIFCDGGAFSHAVEKRNSKYETAHEILALKDYIPDLQIIYRVHHGPDYSLMKEYFEKLGMPDVIFQVSPEPLFTDIVKAADLVISHHSSAISEALCCGVQVIYLCALADIAPSYLNFEAIKVADDFKILPEMVKDILDNPLSREEVRAMAQPYFDRKLCGLDGKANERLASLILKLANIPAAERKKGFESWIDRIDASCEFKSSTWNNLCFNGNV